MYDQVYSHLIINSPHRDTILQVLGQVIVTKDMPPDIDAIGIPANFSTPRWITAILGLKPNLVMQLVTEFHSLLVLRFFISLYGLYFPLPRDPITCAAAFTFSFHFCTLVTHSDSFPSFPLMLDSYGLTVIPTLYRV